MMSQEGFFQDFERELMHLLQLNHLIAPNSVLTCGACFPNHSRHISDDAVRESVAFLRAVLFSSFISFSLLSKPTYDVFMLNPYYRFSVFPCSIWSTQTRSITIKKWPARQPNILVELFPMDANG